MTGAQLYGIGVVGAQLARLFVAGRRANEETELTQLFDAASPYQRDTFLLHPVELGDGTMTLDAWTDLVVDVRRRHHQRCSA